MSGSSGRWPKKVTELIAELGYSSIEIGERPAVSRLKNKRGPESR